ncbi:helix-turn-helix domain-containing protein [Shewanella dokdonensis]|uniref:Helix-turn-helix domain-containing protein n=1 Tax=Shewanella dokdonensis TaxID=712036 RepID=A0ABX8DBG6_9GAMM|nr:helix-turn-helix domain-containing protein [Shewanella dokdonensis]MCL1075494.1 helix-turn-helix domain containing protein [Shewanella dokdonensis]QVK22170.1 helix-turn-helix domain-containing protein [Shewanella dokdonensis]
MNFNCNDKTKNNSIELKSPVRCDGGKTLISRLVHLFNLRGRGDLSELIGVTPGTISTWMTRDSTPFELLIRIHLITNVPMQYLCFGIQLDGMPDKYSFDEKERNRQTLSQPINADGGRTLIKRLIHLFKVRTRIELGELLGITAGTFSTWTTRNTVPHELLVRIHLITGVSLKYLCFGQGNEFPSVSPSTPSVVAPVSSEEHQPQTSLSVFHIENGQLVPSQDYHFNLEAVQAFGLNPKHKALVLQSANKLLFVSCAEKTVTEGTYLYRINDVYKIGEMQLLPDGKVYLLDNGERYAVNSETTHIHGKVVSVLERC